MTFAAFAADWFAASSPRWKPSTRARTRAALDLQILPALGRRHLGRIRPAHVHRWFDRYSRTAPGGANRTLDVARQVFRHAVDVGALRADPTHGLARNPRPEITRFLSRAEIGRLRKALAAHVGRGSGRQQAEIIRLLLATGCRKSEIVRLRWAEVEFGRAEIHLADSKTGPRTVWLSPHAVGILRRQPREPASPWVFPAADDPARPRSDELSLWRRVRRRAGIEDVRLHDLRHTFASQAVLRGVALPVVARLLGHQSEKMTLRYAHVSDRETEAAAERMGAALAEMLAGCRPALSGTARSG